MNSSYGPALRRFWWVLAIGGVLAVAAALLMVYSVEAGVPPKLSAREKPSYTSEVRLFVTSGEAPYLRTSVPRFAEVPIGTDGETTSRPVQQILDAPDVKTLVDAANVYPLFIVSDDVARLREQQFGKLPGEVSAQAIFASATANRYQPSQIPVIELFATAGSSDAAKALAGATSKAFRDWMAREQAKAGIVQKQRILVQELEAPSDAAASGGGGASLPVLAMLAILTAFGAGAIMLDRMYPRPDDEASASGAPRSPADTGETEALDRHVGISETG
jgi:hypothetical protein